MMTETPSTAVDPASQPAYRNAEAYFDQLWHNAQQGWTTGSVTPAAMKHGTTDPVDYILTTVVCLHHQAAAILSAVEAAKAQLQTALPTAFFYLPESLHFTLLGCSPRYHHATEITPDRIAQAYAICREILHQQLANQPSIQMSLRGVGILGNQLFVQVLPHDERWALLRQQIGVQLTAQGAQPLVHPNPAPIHLNLARLTEVTPTILSAGLAAVRALRRHPFGTLTIKRVDLLITDFVISPRHSTACGSIMLPAAD